MTINPESVEGNEKEAADAEYRSRQNEAWARGAASTEVLKQAASPSLILETVGDVMDRYENATKAEAMDQYSVKPHLSIIGERIWALGKPLKWLRENGIVVENDEGILETNIAGFSINSTTKKIEIPTVVPKTTKEVDPETGDVLSTRYEEITEKRSVDVDVPNYGTDKIRKILSGVYEKGEEQAVARMRLDLIFRHAYEANTANLPGIVESYYIKYPFLENDHFKWLFNLPDPKEMEKNPENTGFGDDIADAIKLLYLVTQSEKKEKMMALMEKPGFGDLFKGKEELIEKLIGKVGEWQEDIERDDEEKVEKYRKKDTTEDEVEEGVRGLLTMFGNLYAKGNGNQEAKILSVIEDFLGGNSSAVKIALHLFKVTGLAAENGLEWYGDSEEKITPELMREARELVIKEERAAVMPDVNLTEDEKERLKEIRDFFALEGDPITDDLTKLMHFKEYRIKELLKGRSAGPLDNINKLIDTLCLSLWGVCQNKTEFGKRTMLDQMWGSAEKVITSKDGVKITLPMEPAVRLGDLPWETDVMELNGKDIDMKKLYEETTNSEHLKKLDIEEKELIGSVWWLYSVFPYLSGRNNDEKALLPFSYLENYDPRDFLNKKFFADKRKFAGIVINDLLVNGVSRRHTIEEYIEKHEIKKEYEEYKKKEKKKDVDFDDSREIPNINELDEMTKDFLKNEAVKARSKFLTGYWEDGIMKLHQKGWLWKGMTHGEHPGTDFDKNKEVFTLKRAEQIAYAYGFMRKKPMGVPRVNKVNI